MINILYGDDDLTLREALAEMKGRIAPDELRDVNISTLDGARVSYDELISTCSTVPFLSEKRMVIVEGLLSRFESRTSTKDEKSKQWDGLAEFLAVMPESTDLVLVDGRVNGANPLLKKLRPISKVSTFQMPGVRDLPQWIKARSEKLGVRIEPRAIQTLADTIGRDTRVIDQELQKLALYRAGEEVRRVDVESLVSHAREFSIFQGVDAVIEGRPGLAIQSFHKLLDDGRPATYVISMIARQIRLLLIAKDLRGEGVPDSEMGARLSLSGYPLQKTLEQERNFTTQQLTAIHHKLLMADVAIKTGELDEQLALDILTADLASR